MAATARFVLEDLRAAHDSAHMNPPEDDSKWRRDIVTLLTLLQTVGDAERKDRKRYPSDKKSIIKREWQQRWSKTLIFEHFIRKQRNNVVHQYKFPKITASAWTNAIGASLTTPHVDPHGTYTRIVRRGAIGARADVIGSGAFAGREILDVVEEGIRFWEEYLAIVEKVVGG